jgi:hypothetical protein
MPAMTNLHRAPCGNYFYRRAVPKALRATASATATRTEATFSLCSALAPDTAAFEREAAIRRLIASVEVDARRGCSCRLVQRSNG